MIAQALLTADDIVEIFGPSVSPRTARAWLRAPWSASFRLPGARGRAVSAREFVVAVEQRKLRPGRGRRTLGGPDKARNLSTSCPRCETKLAGFIAPLVFLTVPDVVRLLDGKVGRRAVRMWIRDGLLRGFKLEGVRGTLVEAESFFEDFRVLKRGGKPPQFDFPTTGT